MKDMPQHGALSDATNKVVVVKPPCKRGMLSSTVDEVSMKESEVLREPGVLSSTAGDVSAKKDNTIPSLAIEVACEGEGL